MGRKSNFGNVFNLKPKAMIIIAILLLVGIYFIWYMTKSSFGETSVNISSSSPIPLSFDPDLKNQIIYIPITDVDERFLANIPVTLPAASATNRKTPLSVNILSYINGAVTYQIGSNSPVTIQVNTSSLFSGFITSGATVTNCITETDAKSRGFVSTYDFANQICIFGGNTGAIPGSIGSGTTCTNGGVTYQCTAIFVTVTNSIPSQIKVVIPDLINSSSFYTIKSFGLSISDYASTTVVAGSNQWLSNPKDSTGAVTLSSEKPTAPTFTKQNQLFTNSYCFSPQSLTAGTNINSYYVFGGADNFKSITSLTIASVAAGIAAAISATGTAVTTTFLGIRAGLSSNGYLGSLVNNIVGPALAANVGTWTFTPVNTPVGGANTQLVNTYYIMYNGPVVPGGPSTGSYLVSSGKGASPEIKFIPDPRNDGTQTIIAPEVKAQALQPAIAATLTTNAIAEVPAVTAKAAVNMTGNIYAMWVVSPLPLA